MRFLFYSTRSDVTDRISGAKPAQQQRSRDAAANIAGAARRLLVKRQFSDLTVAEIAKEAGTSVGGFYARFEDKTAILEAIDDAVLAEVRVAFDMAMDQHGESASVSEIVGSYVRVMVEQFAAHRTEINQIRRHAASSKAAGYRARMKEFNEHVHGRLRGELRARMDEIEHGDPEFAMNFALFVVSAAAREAVLANSLSAYPIEVSPGRLIDELSSVFLAQLGIRGSN